MTKHTQGIWEIEPGAGNGAWIGNGNGWAALALGNNNENARANARLIAAAPEMAGDGQFLLDRLDDFEREIEDEALIREWSGHVAPALSRFRAAITKALTEVKS